MKYTKDNREFVMELYNLSRYSDASRIKRTRQFIVDHKLSRDTLNELFIHFHNEWQGHDKVKRYYSPMHVQYALQMMLKHKLAEELDAKYTSRGDPITILDRKRRREDIYGRNLLDYVAGNFTRQFYYQDHGYCLVHKDNPRRVKYIIEEPYYDFVESGTPEKQALYEQHIAEINAAHNKIGLFFRKHDFPTTWNPGATKMFLIGNLTNDKT